jgi:hypothetical protein
VHAVLAAVLSSAQISTPCAQLSRNYFSRRKKKNENIFPRNSLQFAADYESE